MRIYGRQICLRTRTFGNSFSRRALAMAIEVGCVELFFRICRGRFSSCSRASATFAPARTLVAAEEER